MVALLSFCNGAYTSSTLDAFFFNFFWQNAFILLKPLIEETLSNIERVGAQKALNSS
jgi:hypothetical protein